MTRLGTLKNAPLACVLIAIQFEEIDAFEDKAHSLALGVRRLLPRARNYVDRRAGAERLAEIRVFEFVSENLHRSLLLTPFQLSMVATEYSNFDDLIVHFESLLDAVWDPLSPLATRIGVRYIDFIMPREGEKLSDYVLPEVHSAPELGLGDRNRFSSNSTFYQLDDGGLVVRYSTGLGKPSVPEGIGLANLKPSDVMSAPYSGNFAILDTDRFSLIVDKLSKQEVLQRIKVQQKDLSAAFKAVCTKSAFANWKGEK